MWKLKLTAQPFITVAYRMHISSCMVDKEVSEFLRLLMLLLSTKTKKTLQYFKYQLLSLQEEFSMMNKMSFKDQGSLRASIILETLFVTVKVTHS